MPWMNQQGPWVSHDFWYSARWHFQTGWLNIQTRWHPFFGCPYPTFYATSLDNTFCERRSCSSFSHLFCFLFFLGCEVVVRSSWYPSQGTVEDDFPFTEVGLVSFLEGIGDVSSLNCLWSFHYILPRGICFPFLLFFFKPHKQQASLSRTIGGYKFISH